MPFPKAKRIIYKNNPLDKVICQVQFPSILKIDSEVPSNFQEYIRADFPDFVESIEYKIDIPPDTLQFKPPVESKNYQFRSEDGIWQVNLTRNFIALSTDKYLRWEEFYDKLQKPVEAFLNIYKPTNFTRIGLRYIDIINRSELGLNDFKWSDLINQNALGFLSSEIQSNIISIENKSEMWLEDNESKVRIICSIVKKKINDEECFKIDSDFYINKKIDITDLIKYLENFKENGSRLIQWIISKDLHEAMEPSEL